MKVLAMSAVVKTARGRKVLRRGDTVPDDADAKSVKRLKAHGAIGIPEDTEVQAVPDDAEALYASKLGEWVNDATVEQLIEAATSPEKALELLELEQAGKARKTAIESLTEIAAGDTQGG